MKQLLTHLLISSLAMSPCATAQANSNTSAASSAEYAVEQVSEDEARELYEAAPQSVRNVFIFYFAHLYACMGKTVAEQDEDSVDSAYFDIFVDQAIYQDIPSAITKELPSEYAQYLTALAQIWTAALAEADALSGEAANEETYQAILDKTSATELALIDSYPQAVSLTEKLMPHLVTILFDACQMDDTLENASEELQSSTSSEKEYYAKVLDFMGETLFGLIQ
ncbi:MAG: hypothetical protein R3Y56_02530 [Akkermansia sp.]